MTELRSAGQQPVLTMLSYHELKVLRRGPVITGASFAASGPAGIEPATIG